MKTVLIPTDFSKESENAITFVLDFFVDTKLNIVLLNTYLAPKVSRDEIIAANDLAKIKSNNRLEVSKQKILQKSNLSDANVSIVSRMGSLTNVIPHLITNIDQPYDLIVMGKDGGVHVEEVSKALRQINSPCPLVTVYPPKE